MLCAFVWPVIFREHRALRTKSLRAIRALVLKIVYGAAAIWPARGERAAAPPRTSCPEALVDEIAPIGGKIFLVHLRADRGIVLAQGSTKRAS